MGGREVVTIGSLCSGYGGLDMGLQSVIGGEIRWHFEYDKNASKILKHHHPNIPNHGDITSTDWDIEPVDWITAGYPCQPFSTAGLRKGTDDDRHIWPHIANAIRVLRPRGVLLENVAGHLSLGFGQVLGDLASLGYDAQWVCVRAADAGAPHGRRRLFVIAHPKHYGQHENAERRGSSTRPDEGGLFQSERCDSKTVTDSYKHGRQEGNGESGSASPKRPGRTWPGFGPYSVSVEQWAIILNRPTPDPVDANGRLTTTFVEWMMGLPEGHVTNVGIPWTAQMKALGNGVVPQQAALALKMMGVGQ